MSIDTPSKRRSVHGYTNTLILPVADGTVGALDREHAAWLYGGIPAAAPPVVLLGEPCGTVLFTSAPVGLVQEPLLAGMIFDPTLIGVVQATAPPVGVVIESVIAGVIIDCED